MTNTNRKSTILQWTLIVSCTFVVMGLAILPFLSLNAQDGECATGQPLEFTFAVGSTWDLCWSVANPEGVVLHQIHFTTPDGQRRQMMKEASVAQIIVSPDDGGPSLHVMSTANISSTPGISTTRVSVIGALDGGADNGPLLPLTQSDCPNGQLLAFDGQDLLCQQMQPRSYAYRYFDRQQQGEVLSLFSLYQASPTLDNPTPAEPQSQNAPLYIMMWRFFDDGSFEPMVGDAGIFTVESIPEGAAANQAVTVNGTPNDATGTTDATGYVTNVFWRLDIDIGPDGDDDAVEQFDVLDTAQNARREISVSTITTETARNVAPNGKRSWRVRAGTLVNADGHLVSYQLEARDVGHQYVGDIAEPWSQHQLYVTALDPCQRLATQNSPAETCGQDVSQFMNDESLAGKDVVFWYRASAHHLARAEDHPIPNVEWLSFQLIPRDWTATNPLVGGQ